MKQFSTPILEIHSVALDYYELSFAWPEGLRIPLPGQFITLRMNGEAIPFLRRPFALSSYQKESRRAAIIFQKRGAATTLLASMVAGQVIDVLGPRGFPFPWHKEQQHRKALLLGGGIGAGPMIFASQWLAQHGARPDLYLGFRNQSLALSPRLEVAVNFTVCTDDGSQGFHGNVLQALEAAQPGPESMLWVCGPGALLRASHEWAQKRGIPCYVLMEEMMACGVGACMGCAVPMVGGGYERACTEGPVFESTQIRWEDLV